MNQPASQSDFDRKVTTAPMMIRAAEVRPGSYLEEDNSIELTWSTGAVGLRFDWWDGEYYLEELSMEPTAVRLDRLNAGACLLNTHQDYDLGSVLGSVVPGTAKVENGEGVARVRLATTPDVADTNQKIIDGHIRFVSVGYMVHEYLRTEKEGEKPHLLAVDWEPVELSMVAVPFDAGARVRARNAQQGGTHPCIIRGAAATMEDQMSDQNSAGAAATRTNEGQQQQGADGGQQQGQGQQQSDAGTSGTGQQQQGAGDGQQQDQGQQGGGDRALTVTVQQIRERAGVFGADFTLDLVSRHADKPLTKADLDAALVDRFTQDRSVDRIDSSATIAVDERDKYRKALTGALLVRITDSPDQPKDGGEMFGHMSTREIARDYLTRNGVKGHAAYGPMELVSAALGMQRHGAQTTSDFAIALQNAGNLAIIEAYEQLEEGQWRQLSKEGSFNDFRPHNLAGLTGTPEFLVVEENGEYTYASFGDIGRAAQLWTAGRIISLSRQLIINDQLGLFGDMAGHLGRGAALHEANSVWANLLGNVTLGDGVALFHATHGNLAGTPSALTADSLSAGRTAMAEQKDRDGVTPLYIRPKYLVYGPKNAGQVDKLMSPTLVPTTTGAVVPQFVRELTPVLEPRITDYAWYLVAEPRRQPVLTHGYLRGQRGIYTDTRVGFEVDGVEYKGRLDFNATAVDHRGAYKNAGAAPS